MDSITFNKKNALILEWSTNIIEGIFAILVLLVLSKMGITFLYQIGSYILLLIFIITTFRMAYFFIVIRSLFYWMEPNKLIKEWTFLVKNRKNARLQVINDIFINQSLLAKLLGFNMYSVTVSYGFGDEGYNFTFHFLDQTTAYKIAEEITPKGLGVEVK